MVRTEDFDRPEDYQGVCELCGKPMRVTHHLLLHHWLATRAHDRCIEVHFSVKAIQTPCEIPDRFVDFDPQKANQRAIRLAEGFSPQSKVKTLAILGVPGQGKSRLLWAAVTGFFDQLGGSGWVEHFGFEQLMSELDRVALTRIAHARFVLVDDIGCIESYGKERAALQAALRSRIKDNKWTFLTIDSLDFDPGLEDVLKHHALVVAL